MSDTLKNLVTAHLRQSGQLTQGELAEKLAGVSSADLAAALSSLTALAAVKRSPRGKYYLPGHTVAAPASIRTAPGGKSALVQFGVVSGSGSGFSVDDRLIMPGDVMTNRELMDALHVSNMGGIRVSRATRSVVIVSSADNTLYKDRWQDGVFNYTGKGQYGDQEMTGGNAAIADSRQSGDHLVLFFKRKANQYEFQGEVRLAEDPKSEQQADENGMMRRVWVFPLTAI